LPNCRTLHALRHSLILTLNPASGKLFSRIFTQSSVVVEPDIPRCPADASIQENAFPVAGDPYVLSTGKRIADKQEYGNVKKQRIFEGNGQPAEPVAIEIVCEWHQSERGESNRYGIERGHSPEGHGAECPSAVATALRYQAESGRLRPQQNTGQQMCQFVQDDPRQPGEADHQDVSGSGTSVEQEQRDDKHDAAGMPPDRDIVSHSGGPGCLQSAQTGSSPVPGSGPSGRSVIQ